MTLTFSARAYFIRSQAQGQQPVGTWGDVIDAPVSSDKEMADAERDVEVMVEQASNLAKSRGKTPGCADELLDAYKKNELDAASGVAVYSMSSRLTDKAEPSEALAATTVWSYGLGAPRYLLSARQLNDFRKGFPVAQESDVHGQRGAYFVTDHLQLSGGAQCHWGVVADVNQGPAAIADLIDRVVNGRCTEDAVNRDIDAGRARLQKMIGTADGFQASAEPRRDAVHRGDYPCGVP